MDSHTKEELREKEIQKLFDDLMIDNISNIIYTKSSVNSMKYMPIIFNINQQFLLRRRSLFFIIFFKKHNKYKYIYISK